MLFKLDNLGENFDNLAYLVDLGIHSKVHCHKKNVPVLELILTVVSEVIP